MKSFYAKKVLTVPLIFFLQKTKKSESSVIYELPVRIVRFKISDDSYEVIATNLSEDLFLLMTLNTPWGLDIFTQFYFLILLA